MLREKQAEARNHGASKEKEPAPDGPAKGCVVNQDRLLDLIYEAKGWDSQGMPTRQKLDELGL